METPVPNFYFMGVQFLHLLALAVWVGGIIILRGIVTPALFLAQLSPERYRILVNEIFRRFNRATLFCAGALIATGVIKFWQWENLTPWNSIRYLSIMIMSFVAVYIACGGKEGLKNRGLSQDKNKKNSRENPHFQTNEPGNVFTQSDSLTLLSFICGLAAILMA